MLPFRLAFRPGISLYEQVVYAAKKAVISGQMRPGDPFPSVRALSKELKINPNTAHKVVGHLVAERVLEVLPGIGTVVAAPSEASASQKKQLVESEMEQLVVEAKKLGMELDDVQAALSEHWRKLGGNEEKHSPELKAGGREE